MASWKSSRGHKAGERFPPSTGQRSRKRCLCQADFLLRHSGSQSVGFSFMLDAQWPLLFTFWPLCIFAHGLWSLVIVIRTVADDHVVWALCESVQKAPSQPGDTLTPGVGCEFLVFLLLYFATHQQQLLLPLHPVLSLFWHP